MSLDVVISRYKKNVDFVYKLKNRSNTNIRIYDKCNNDNIYNIPVNKGNEASVYLRYIVDNYDKLPEYIYFIHDEEYAWHHTGSLLDKLNIAYESGKEYFNINDKCLNSMNDVIMACEIYGWKNDFKQWYNKYIEEYVPFHLLDVNKKNENSAQFLVKRERIINLPKKLYNNLYNWIINTEYENAKSGRFLEWTWHILWDIYPILKNSKDIEKLL